MTTSLPAPEQVVDRQVAVHELGARQPPQDVDQLAPRVGQPVGVQAGVHQARSGNLPVPR